MVLILIIPRAVRGTDLCVVLDFLDNFPLNILRLYLYHKLLTWKSKDYEVRTQKPSRASSVKSCNALSHDCRNLNKACCVE